MFASPRELRSAVIALACLLFFAEATIGSSRVASSEAGSSPCCEFKCRGGGDDGMPCSIDEDCVDGACERTCTLSQTQCCQANIGGSTTVVLADSGIGDRLCAPIPRVADDFVALEDGLLSSICVNGQYLVNTGANIDSGALAACDPLPDDSFSVTLYADGDGKPGTLMNIRSATTLSREIAHFDSSGDPVWTHELALDAPVGPVEAGQTYFIEVTNANPIGDVQPFCDWFWASADAGEGNGGSWHAYDSSYLAGAFEPRDMAFCLNLPFEAPPTPVGPCCVCDERVCFETTAVDCQLEGGEYQAQATSCAEGCPDQAPKENDECGGAIEFENTFANFCASDGPPDLSVLANCDGSNTTITGDLWYSFFFVYGGPQFISVETTGGTGRGAAVAVYSNESSQCGFPSEHSMPASCLETECLSTTGLSYVEFETGDCECVLIRVGGVDGTETRGRIGLTEFEGGFVKPLPLLADPSGPGGAARACDGGDNHGILCTRCDGGERIGEACIDDAGCPGASCAPDNNLCTGLDEDCTPATCSASAPHTRARWLVLAEEDFEDTFEVRVTILRAPSNPALVGKVRWLQPSTEIPEGDTFTPGGVTFRGATLGCEPASVSFGSPGTLSVFGDEIVPGGLYALEAAYPICPDALGEYCFSRPLLIQTHDWGDVVAPFAHASPTRQPDVNDILAVVDKFLGLASAPPKNRAMQVPAVLNVQNAVRIGDILAVVDAFLGTPYPAAFAADPNDCD